MPNPYPFTANVALPASDLNAAVLAAANGTLSGAAWGTGVATFLVTPTSANLRAAVTDESGTGALLFAGGDIGAATGTSLVASGLLQAGTTLGISTDVLLNRTGANSLALRNGTNGQTFRAYNTWTDASNGEWGVFGWGSNTLSIGSDINGTGTARSVSFVRGGTEYLRLASTGSEFVGFVGIGSAIMAPVAQLDISGDVSAAAWAGNGIQARTRSATFTDTSSSGTVPLVNIVRVGTPTIAASSSTTFTRAASVSIAAAPVAGTNVTIGNAYALDIVSGPALFRGGSTLLGSTYANRPAGVEAGTMAYITDSNTATWRATIAGGGANKVIAWYDGTNWLCMG